MAIRWYRSRFFWFGLVGLMMLLIGWFSFPGTEFEVGYTTRGTYGLRANHVSYGVHKDRSYTGFNRGNYDSATLSVLSVWPGWQALSFPEEKGEGAPLFGRAWILIDEPAYSDFSLANWFIVTVYIILWLGGLVLWQRRKERLMNPKVVPDGA